MTGRWLTGPPPNIDALRRNRDVPGLIQALKDKDHEIQFKASEALTSIGTAAVEPLIAAIGTPSKDVRLGIIEALGAIGDPRAFDSLVIQLKKPESETRWEAALALGHLGDPRAIPAIIDLLRDYNKYVRHGAALALDMLGWEPREQREHANLLFAREDWEGLVSLGPEAIPALALAVRDHDPMIRNRTVECLGEIGHPDAIPALYRFLSDQDEQVRWNAVLAAPRCGFSILYIPRALSRRPRTRKDPRITAFLNFVLPGMGYLYLGKWWGILIFQIDVYVTLWLFAFGGEGISYTFLLPVYAALALHGWYTAKKMPDI